MKLDIHLLWIILGCAVVTWLPRIIPFMFVRTIQMPDLLLRWLKYIPVCILSALVISSLLERPDQFVTFNWPMLFAFIPALATAIWTKSLSLTVVVGVVSMAVIRYVW